jgi:hypothetical protein
MNTVTFKARLRSRHRPRKSTPARPTARPRRSDRAARMLALAYHLDRLIEDGVLRDYADAAQVLGVSRARVTQIMDLLGLPPAAKEEFLDGRRAASERSLRRRNAAASET